MRQFKWKNAESRRGCVSAIAIRMYLQQITAEEALGRSLNRYCDNGDLISRREREGLLIDAKLLAREAKVQSDRSRMKRKAM